eukprot:TRINITY_DN14494_c0_g1_i1.p1 TRINITY_DN14494_c0_g1~~TRINITY_DN14494_c0_g1_i1.p1  ORF type:complete len:114 (-),score=19.89 TRINITY_DN14494_c0_g1_i1:359-700(-)
MTSASSSTSSDNKVFHSYILMVQHLIERCLKLYMDRDDCVEALEKYAHVKPVITLTVWKELEKENKDFFAAYAQQIVGPDARAFNQALEEATAKLCQQKLDECAQLFQQGPLG